MYLDMKVPFRLVHFVSVFWASWLYFLKKNKFNLNWFHFICEDILAVIGHNHFNNLYKYGNNKKHKMNSCLVFSFIYLFYVIVYMYSFIHLLM